MLIGLKLPKQRKIFLHHRYGVPRFVLYCSRGHPCGNASVRRLHIPEVLGQQPPNPMGKGSMRRWPRSRSRDRAASSKGREGLATLPYAFMAVSQKQSPGNRMNRRVNKRRKTLAAYPPHSYPSTSSPSPRTGLTVPTPPLPSHKQAVTRGYTKFGEKTLKRGFTIFPLPLRFLGPRGVQKSAHNLSTLYQHPDRKLIHC